MCAYNVDRDRFALWLGQSRRLRKQFRQRLDRLNKQGLPDGVTVIFRAKHTLSRELASQADPSEILMMLESLRNGPHQPFFSIITANAAIMEQ